MLFNWFEVTFLKRIKECMIFILGWFLLINNKRATVTKRLRVTWDGFIADINFNLQQLYFPFDGYDPVTLTSPATFSDVKAVFPKGADFRNVPVRQGAKKFVVLEAKKQQYGSIRGAYDWIYDLDQSPTGVTILFYFYLPEKPTGPVYLLSTKDFTLPNNEAGFVIEVDSATSHVEIRFGNAWTACAKQPIVNAK